MSSEIIIVDNLKLVGTAAAVAVGAAVALPAVIAAGVGKGLYEVGKNVLDVAKISVEENKSIKELSSKLKEYTTASQNTASLQETYDKIINYYSKNNTLLGKQHILEIINKESNLKDKVNVGYKLMEIESKYSVLKEKYYSLNELSEQVDYDISDVINSFNNLDEGSLSDIEKSIEQLSQKINETQKEIKQIYEESLKNKVFVNEFYSVERQEDRILLSIFNTELNKMLENTSDKQVIEMVNKTNTLSILKRIYNMCSIISNDSAFKKYANRVLSLWSKAIILSGRDDISLEDYKYELNLISQTLDEIEQTIVEERKELYKAYNRFYELLSINNEYRKILHIEQNAIDFNIDSYIYDCEKLEIENKELENDYNNVQIARSITEQLVKKYTKENYKLAVTTAPKKIKSHVILKTYLLTPDGKNVLCLSVNEQGKISGEVTGVKIPGLQDDKSSIFEAQKGFCSHTKKVLETLAAEIGIETPETISETPDLISTTRSVDYSNVLPPYIYNMIKNARSKKANEQVRRRSI